jgi:hypothetical protein
MDPLYRFLHNLELPDYALQDAESLLAHLEAFYVELPFTQLMHLARGYPQVKTLLESKGAEAFWQAKLAHDYPGLVVLGAPWRQRYVDALRLATYVRRTRTGVVDARLSQAWHPATAQTVGFFSLVESAKPRQMVLTHLPTRILHVVELPADTQRVWLRRDYVLVVRALVYDVYELATQRWIVAAPAFKYKDAYGTRLWKETTTPLNATFNGLMLIVPDALPGDNLVVLFDTTARKAQLLDVGAYARRIAQVKLTLEHLRSDCVATGANPAHSDYVRRFGTVFRTDGSDSWRVRPDVSHGPFWGSEGIYALAIDAVGNIKVHRLRDDAVEAVEVNPALVSDAPRLVCVYGDVLLWCFTGANMCMLSVRGHSICLRVPGEAVLLDERCVYVRVGGELRRVELEGVSVGAACVACGAVLSSVSLPFCAVECCE